MAPPGRSLHLASLFLEKPLLAFIFPPGIPCQDSGSKQVQWPRCTWGLGVHLVCFDANKISSASKGQRVR